jgi:hypothetical protein
VQTQPGPHSQVSAPHAFSGLQLAQAQSAPHVQVVGQEQEWVV